MAFFALTSASGPTSRSSRSKRGTGPHRLSAICAALEYISDNDSTNTPSCHDNLSQMDYEEESGGEGSVAEPEENVQWMLYNAVKEHKNSLGQNLSDPFLKLPSRRHYANYYEQISHPISMFHVRKKIKVSEKHYYYQYLSLVPM